MKKGMAAVVMSAALAGSAVIAPSQAQAGETNADADKVARIIVQIRAHREKTRKANDRDGAPSVGGLSEGNGRRLQNRRPPYRNPGRR